MKGEHAIYRLGNDVEIKLVSTDDIDIGHDTAAAAAAAAGKGSQSQSVLVEQTGNGWYVDLTNFKGRIEVYRIEMIEIEKSSVQDGDISSVAITSSAQANGDDRDTVVTDDNDNDAEYDDKKATKTSDSKNTIDDDNVLSALNFETSPVLPPVKGDGDPIEPENEVTGNEKDNAAKEEILGVDFEVAASEDVQDMQNGTDEANVQVMDPSPSSLLSSNGAIHSSDIENLCQPDEVKQHENQNRLLSTPSLKKVSWRISRQDIYYESLSLQGTGLNDKSSSMASTPGSFDDPVEEASLTPSALAADNVPPPTRLHQLCTEGDVTLEELSLALEMDPESAKIKDEKGRYPLHLLGDNDELVSTASGRNTATVFAAQLMAAHPDAMLTLDERGLMPFVSIVLDWVVWVYRSHEDSRKNKNFSPKGVAAILGFNSPPSEDTLLPVVDTYTGSRSRYSDEKKDEALENSSRVFPRVDIWNEVEWALSMLSVMMDELGGRNEIIEATPVNPRKALSHRKEEGDKRRLLAVHVITVLPTLLRTVLLIEKNGGVLRKKILSMSIFRRIFLCRESVGDWITEMLRRSGAPSRRAVDYFSLVSEVTVADFSGGFRTLLTEDVKAFQSARNDVFEAIDGLDGVISSLVVLEASETTRAASTAAIWHTLSERLSRPFVLALTLIDLILLFTLMLAFRSDVSLQSEFEGLNLNVPTSVVVFICTHYLLRKACEAFALFSVSVGVFRKYFTNLWQLLDLMAIILTLTAIIWNDANPGQYRNGLNAFVVGLLWLKVLAFLKIVNKQMSTFIHALMQILFDLRYFMIVLVVVLAMFGDMLNIAVSTKDNGEFCKVNEDLEPPTEDFCNPNYGASYLRVYSMLIGDYELSELRDTEGITVLFVIFTLIGVVILLNVLIAVVSDSYEKATMSSSLIFGGARVVFVTQNEALETFLQPGSDPLQLLNGRHTAYAPAVFRICRWLVLVAIIVTVFSAFFFHVTQTIEIVLSPDTKPLPMIFMILLSLLLSAALWIMIMFALQGFIRPNLRGRFAVCVYDTIDKYTNRFVSAVSRRLFGLKDNAKGERASFADNAGPEEEDWTGRLHYLENRFQVMLSEAKNELQNDIHSLEQKLNENGMDMRRGSAMS